MAIALAVGGGQPKRCHPVAICSVGIRTRAKQQSDRVCIVETYSPVESGHTVRFRAIYSSPLPDEDSQPAQIVSSYGCDDAIIAHRAQHSYGSDCQRDRAYDGSLHPDLS